MSDKKEKIILPNLIATSSRNFHEPNEALKKINVEELILALKSVRLDFSIPLSRYHEDKVKEYIKKEK